MATNPLSTVLGAMRQKTVTLGWDAIVAYDATAVNDLFAEQFVSNVRFGQSMPPITGQIPDGTGGTINAVGLTLGPPLISFAPGQGQQATVTMDFVAGEIMVLETMGRVECVTGYQQITPGDGYQLSMTVQLDQVTGSDNNNVVYVDISKANDYSANLLPGTAAALYLGQYFKSTFTKQPDQPLKYELGTLITGSSENLTPVSFEIRTQVYPGTKGPQGAVLLLVATTYNPDGGQELGSDFPYLIPDGCRCALVVQSKTLFADIIAPYYTTTLVGSPKFSVGYFEGSSPAAFLSCVSGQIDAGPFQSSWSSGIQFFNVWSGTEGTIGEKGLRSMIVPYSGWKLEPENDLLTMNWHNQFNQPFASSVSTRGGPLLSGSDIALTVSASFRVKASVSNQNIAFAGDSSPSVAVTFQSSPWYSRWFGNGNARNKAGTQMVNSITPEVNKIMNVPVPQVNAFAVSHLLFPAENVLTYSAACLPGDLAVFGSIEPGETAFTLRPLSPTVGAGQQVTFQTVGASGTTTWELAPQVGTISADGTYTAPSVVHQAGRVMVTATQGTDVATAVIMVVPDGVTVAPAYAIVFGPKDSVAFQAATLGQMATATWSLSPADGSAGSISSSGVYTPPANLPGDIQTVTVTATVGSATGSALICLADVSLELTVSPLFAVLGANGEKSFTIEQVKVQPTWSILPAIGSIDQDGNYCAPASIETPQTVLVVAEYPDPLGSAYGIALVILQPAS